MQSTLSPHGPAASEIAGLAWVLFAGGGAILLLVLAATSWAIWAKPARRGWLARGGFVAAAGIGFPVVALSALLVHAYLVGGRLHSTQHADLKIEVTAEQWWWRVRYLDATGNPAFETANELRIPAGRPVELVLRSADVIHSFWVPSLAGKIDMIPGRAQRLAVMAAREGVYRGQCAEFCGGPHALMALHVIAGGTEEFELWRDQQARPAASGNAIFNARCAACHVVRGTDAAGTRGPDLTHVASRLFIAAGTLPNNAATMTGWLADSQHVKPGNLMPSMRLTGAELNSLAAYVATLK
jgi:cytochrome c oxidase subunit II